jgi:integrase
VAGVHPHRFRHDAARRLVEAVDLPTVAALLGHRRLDTVRVSGQPDQAALERAAAVVETQERPSRGRRRGLPTTPPAA